MNLDIRYYLSICWRRLPLFLPISMVLAAASFFYAISLPAQYESSTTLLVESAQISDDLAQSTVSVDPNEQLQIIQQRLMTRANLLDIARRFDVFDNIAEMSADEIVRTMRASSTISVLSGRAQATRMTMSFTTNRPVTAANVLNEYLTVILAESAEFRKSRAEGTLEFFEQEVERLSRSLDQQSARIMTFQSENSEALPSTLGYRLDRQGQLQERLSRNEQERLSLQDQKRRMIQIFEMTGGQANRALQSPQQQELDALKSELRQALLVYSTENPKVKLLQARIDALEEGVAARAAEAGRPVDAQEALIELQVEEIEARLTAIAAQNVTTQAEIDRLQETIDRTPGNDISLEALNREFTILENQYNGAVGRLSAAATGERIEVLSKGERITIVEHPSIPDEPTSPNRVLIAGAGSGLGLGFAVGLVVLLELLNSAIRRPVDITSRFGITPLGVLPVIRTPGDRIIKGGTLLVAVSLVVVGVPAVLFAVHTYYLPLDLLADKAMNRLGI